VGGVHGRDELFDQAEGNANSKHTHRDAQHYKQGAKLVVPKVKPHFFPDYRHDLNICG